MAQEARPLDASNMPDVSRLVQEVNRTGRARLIQVGGDRARLSPARPQRRRKALTPTQRKEILTATFGAWKGLVDPAELKRELTDLQRDERPPRSL